MTGLEITLFILGTAFIIISFFIVDNSEKSPKATASRALDADAFEQLRNDFAERTTKEADIILHEAEDKLESLSNDKIIAVGEYSDQVLEKIGANHKEVVFLYQMLNEKEEDLKSTATRLDNVRIECEKMIKAEEERRSREEQKKAEEEQRREQEALNRAREEQNRAREEQYSTQAAQLKQNSEQERTDEDNQNSVQTQSIRNLNDAGLSQAVSGTAEQTSAQTGSASAKTAAGSGMSHVIPGTIRRNSAATRKSAVASTGAGLRNASAAPEKLDTGSLSRNDEIIALHKKGKSVMEISKLLGMGQGEVKLIIDLYC